MSTDEDLKMSDTLRYYERDTQAALVRSNLIIVMNYSLTVFF